MRKPWKLFITILILIAAAVYIDWPGISYQLKVGSYTLIPSLQASKIDINIFGYRVQRDLGVKQGLDLAGGSALTLQVDMIDVSPADRQQALDSDTEVIRRRVNLFGTSEPLIQESKVGNNYRIRVELPSVSDVNQAAQLVGTTAKLEIRETINPTLPITYDNTKPTGITGADFQSATVTFPTSTSGGQASGSPVVSFQLTDQGGKKFDALTKRLIGQPLPIFLDQQLIEQPVVQQEISGGSGQISGNFTADTAKVLSTELNAGALKAPVKIIEQTTISPILGSQPIQRSLLAGALGLLIIAMFMIIYYGRYGVVATFALITYALITLSIFKLVPVTLTLAGIAGFILSVGMAVDANILIFERMREELRSGKKKDVATELGFNRAWTSIRDSNIATIATSLILFYTTTDLVRGFALTLLIGVVASMFTAIVVTRTFLRMFLKY